jgi:hypothetical protein
MERKISSLKDFNYESGSDEDDSDDDDQENQLSLFDHE